MHVKVLIIVTCFICLSSFSQSEERLSIEFAGAQNDYAMDKVNSMLTSNVVNSPTFYPPGTTINTIRTGYSFQLTAAYHVLHFVSIGVFGAYQEAHIHQNPFITYDFSNGETQIIEAQHRFQVSNYNYGISSELLINKLFHFDTFESLLLQRIEIGIPLKFGFSQFTSTSVLYDKFNGYTGTTINKATNYMGKTGLKLGFNFLKEPIFSSIGFELGYQFNKSRVLKDFVGNELEDFFDGTKINADFSGAYFGFYLNFRR